MYSNGRMQDGYHECERVYVVSLLIVNSKQFNCVQTFLMKIKYLKFYVTANIL